MEQIAEGQYAYGPAMAPGVQAVGYRQDYRFDGQGVLISRETTDRVMVH